MDTAGNSYASQLENEITCGICLEIFTDPRTLNCLHTFCLKCVKYWYKECQKKGTQFRCPTCKVIIQVDDVANLPRSFTFNTLIELHQNMANANKHNNKNLQDCAGCRQPKQLVGVCVDCHGLICDDCMNEHRSVPALIKTHEATLFGEFTKAILTKYINNKLFCKENYHEQCRYEFYCKTCKKCICPKCATIGHDGHAKVSIEEAADGVKRIVENKKNKLNDLLKKYNKDYKYSSEKMQRIEADVQSAKENVHKHTEQLITLFREKENAAIRRLDDILEKQKKINDEEKKEIESVVENVSELKQQCETIVDDNLQQFLLEGYECFENVCDNALQNTSYLSKKPLKTNLSVHFIPNPEVAPMVRDLKLGEVVECVTDPSRCSIESFSNARCGFVNAFQIVTRNSNGEVCYTHQDLIDVQIQDDTGHDEMNEISEAENGRFVVKYRPEKPSPCKVFVRFGGKEIQNSPQNIETIEAGAQLKPLNIIDLKETGNPFTLAVSDKGGIAVVTLQGEALLFDIDGKYLCEFGKGSGQGRLTCPCGIIFNEDTILISDNPVDGGCIKEYGLDSTYKRTVCKLTKGKHFSRCCYADDNIMWSMYDRNTKETYIRLLDKRNYDHCHDIKLDVPDDVNGWPVSIAYGNKKYFVTFHLTNSVCIFTDRGGFLRKCGETGGQECQLDDAFGLAVFGDDLLVCDCFNNRVQVFSQDGQFISSFGCQGTCLGQLFRPIDVSVAQDGRVFVLQLRKKRIQVWK